MLHHDSCRSGRSKALHLLRLLGTLQTWGRLERDEWSGLRSDRQSLVVYVVPFRPSMTCNRGCSPRPGCSTRRRRCRTGVRTSCCRSLDVRHLSRLFSGALANTGRRCATRKRRRSPPRRPRRPRTVQCRSHALATFAEGACRAIAPRPNVRPASQGCLSPLPCCPESARGSVRHGWSPRRCRPGLRRSPSMYHLPRRG